MVLPWLVGRCPVVLAGYAACFEMAANEYDGSSNNGTEAQHRRP